MNRDDEKMRICLLSIEFPPMVGGVASHVHGLAKGLAALGHEVEVVSPGANWAFRGVGLREERHGAFRVLRVKVPYMPRITLYYLVPIVARTLSRLVHQRRYQVVHWHSPIESRIVRAVPHDCAKVFTNHTSYFLRWQVMEEDRALARATLSPANAVIAPSEELAAASVDAGFDADRVWMIPNGVDTSKFSPVVDGSVVRRKYGIASSEKVVLCARRLVKKNGVIHWCYALPRILERLGKDFPVRFIFVGDYRLKKEYSDRKRVLDFLRKPSIQKNVVVAGEIPNNDMPAYLAAADAAVLPSLAEATSVAGLEAMATGVPLIGTRVGGIPTILADGRNGYLVPPGSPGALAEAAVKLLRDEGLRREMGRRGRLMAERRFSWKVIAAKTVEVYEACLRTPGNASAPDSTTLL